MLKKNQLLRVWVEDLNNLGFGVAKAEGEALFIKGAVDGDEVTAKVILANKTYAVAKTEEILTPSPHRIHSDCPAKGCGGCAYREIDYRHELALKENYVRFAFRKAGLSDAVILPVVSNGKTAHYRNKAQFAIAPDKDGKCAAGFFAPKSHRLVPAVLCPLQDRTFAPILSDVLDFCNTHGILPYEEEKHKGLLRHVYLRASAKGEVLLTLVLNGRKLPKADAFAAFMKEKHPEVIGCYLNVNPHKTNVICGEEYTLLFGQPYLFDLLCGVSLSLSPASFYQVNREMAEALYRHAAELAGFTGKESLLDLYCGVGSIGLSMAGSVRELVGVEIVPSAVERARENAVRAGRANARFFCADAGGAKELLSSIRREMGEQYRPDAVVLDPPRKGCAEELLACLCTDLCPEKIVYVSCDPDTLARDAKYLVSHGYVMSPVTPFDLFPRTGHVETVVLMARVEK